MIERFQGKGGRRVLIDALRGQRIVQDDPELATELASIAEIKQFAPDEDIIIQDEADNCIYLLIAGRVSVLVHGREVANRAAGNHVGEMAVIDPTARRSATIRAIEATVTAGIQEDAFAQLAKKHPELWRRLALELASRLRERNRLVRQRNDTPEVFVGCSAAALPIAQQVQTGLSHDPFVTTVWTDDVFRPSRSTIENLLAQVERSDFAVLVLSEDDTLVKDDAEVPAPRDNVVFELGLFMGALGQRRAMFVIPRKSKLKIPSDLWGITPIDFPDGKPTSLASRLGPVCNAIRSVVNELGPR